MKHFLIIMILGLLLISCGGDPIKTEDSWTYSVIEIDGMTCVKWSSSGYTSGLTCNWNEWEGEVR